MKKFAVTPISHLMRDGQFLKKMQNRGYLFEGRDHTADLKIRNTILFHSEAQLIHPWNKSFRLELLSKIKSFKGLKAVSFHAASCNPEAKIVDGIFQRNGRVLTRKEMIRFAENNVAWLREEIGSRIEISVENNNAYQTSAYQTIADPRFLTEIVVGNGICFLFDIAHSKITCQQFGLNWNDYVKNLPLDHCNQLHLSQPKYIKNKGLRDSHAHPLSRTLREWVRWVDLPKLRYITIEYYKNAERLYKTLICLETLIGKLNHA